MARWVAGGGGGGGTQVTVDGVPVALLDIDSTEVTLASLGVFTAIGGVLIFAGSNPAMARPTLPAGTKAVWFCTSQPSDMAEDDVYVSAVAL